MENNIIVFTVALPLTLSLLAIAVSFVVLVNNASVVVSKIVDNGLSVLFTKPVLRLLLISLLALLMIYCKKCLLPSTKPDLMFNDNGVCSACEAHDNKVLIS